MIVENENKAPSPRNRLKSLAMAVAAGVIAGAATFYILTYVLTADSPILVGDGSVKFLHSGGGLILQTDHRYLILGKTARATSMTVEPQPGTTGSTQTIALSPDWYLSDSATPNFTLVRGNLSRGEVYVAYCPGADWTGTGPTFTCTPPNNTQLTPVTLNLSNNGCPGGSNQCVLGGTGKWTLRLNY